MVSTDMSTNMNANELALLAKTDKQYIESLWLGVYRLITLWAHRYCKDCDNRYDLDDLTQSAYFALLNAVDDYTADCGYAFTTYLYNHCRNEFRAVLGIRSSKREPDIYSLDSPVNTDMDITLGDTITDETADMDSVIDDIFNNQLRAALDKALDIIPALNRAVVESRFYDGLNLTQTADALGLNSYGQARRLEYQALRALRRGRAYSILKGFDYYGHGLKRTGFSYFRYNLESSVEAAVLRHEEYYERFLHEMELKNG